MVLVPVEVEVATTGRVVDLVDVLPVPRPLVFVVFALVVLLVFLVFVISVSNSSSELILARLVGLPSFGSNGTVIVVVLFTAGKYVLLGPLSWLIVFFGNVVVVVGVEVGGLESCLYGICGDEVGVVEGEV